MKKFCCPEKIALPLGLLGRYKCHVSCRLLSYTSFSRFLQTLEAAGELKRIVTPVDTNLQITELADREMKASEGGKALLFDKPLIDGKLSTFPLAINTMGSYRRIALALGRSSVEELAEQIRSLLKVKPPRGLREAVAVLLRKGCSLIRAHPKRVSGGPCKEVIHRFDGLTNVQALPFSLKALPILKCWPQDGGRFITLPTVYTQDPDSGARNIGIYRMQVYDGVTTGMHWQVHKVAARHGKRYLERKERMPVAVALGGDPALTLAATAPLPDGLDELLFAGLIRRHPIDLVRCETVDIDVPAHSDFVLEGYIEPGELRPEGPFGDHTGFYTPVDDYPVFHLQAITHQREAVYPTTIVGMPPMEDFYVGSAILRIFLPILQMHFPEIIDVALPAEGVFHNLLFVSIRKQYAWQAYKIMHGLWGMGQMMFSKYVVIVDEDCDVHNTSEVLFRLCANTDPQRDTSLVKNPSDALDHAPTAATLGTHMGFDATRKFPTEGYTRGWPNPVCMSPEIRLWADKFMETPCKIM
ncbi:3-octaprenyl-4-hydroxybenzoate carboxy-lyase [Candidatus Xiphinematobacter sp. Idaho Grape]|uniref:menaquinone biosynthesis decarboxylase n=1 Tax=Candidatus Xiphinematobacter sp. Idaho Grape TaxID=1704307 RepID=UPI000706AA5B|nr:menaquinone biosynthesis decarboxylase [Candidatus Xiphinematobacter sp. Idaho Grape]ALJ56359.1 3-octaprenyl-4-hydroxybenzoate carboxy-lyase [Candidatus Xiphinematobacter sp. Idaho Grape]